jgi:hypothetical protein
MACKLDVDFKWQGGTFDKRDNGIHTFLRFIEQVERLRPLLVKKACNPPE